MIQRLTACAFFVVLSACASSPPESAAPVTVAKNTASTDPILSVSETSLANAEAAVATSTAAETEEGLHVVAVPTVAKTAQAPIQPTGPHPDEVVCKREKTTGSHRLVRVCRTRAQIDQEREDGQAMARGLTSKPDGLSSR